MDTKFEIQVPFYRGAKSSLKLEPFAHISRHSAQHVYTNIRWSKKEGWKYLYRLQICLCSQTNLNSIFFFLELKTINYSIFSINKITPLILGGKVGQLRKRPNHGCSRVLRVHNSNIRLNILSHVLYKEKYRREKISVMV